LKLKLTLLELLESKPYRSGCWAPSKELAGAIAQVQGTVSSAVESLSSKINPSDSQGNPTGEEIFNYQEIIPIGSMSEFVSENGVNKDKIRSFELL
jgi:hypothetical protein